MITESVCAECGKSFTYDKITMRRTFCDDCRDKRAKARRTATQKRYRQKRRIKRDDGMVQRTIICAFCGKEYTYSKRRNGRLKSYCPACVNLAHVKQQMEYYHRQKKKREIKMEA